MVPLGNPGIQSIFFHTILIFRKLYLLYYAYLPKSGKIISKIFLLSLNHRLFTSLLHGNWMCANKSPGRGCEQRTMTFSSCSYLIRLCSWLMTFLWRRIQRVAKLAHLLSGVFLEPCSMMTSLRVPQSNISRQSADTVSAILYDICRGSWWSLTILISIFFNFTIFILYSVRSSFLSLSILIYMNYFERIRIILF